MNPIAELRAFVTASLVRPVEPPQRLSMGTKRRARIAAAITLVAGATMLYLALRIEPGDPLFYPATLGLAAIWTIGAFAGAHIRAGRAWTRDGRPDGSPVVQGLALGVLLIGIFVLGALVVAQIPFLRAPVDQLLDHARFGSLPIVIAITAVNGIAEELFFRGALYNAIPRRYAVPATTVIYAVMTAASGVPLLVFAAVVLGVVTGLQRRVTGGLLGPVITHITWSLGMLLLLPPLLDVWG